MTQKLNNKMNIYGTTKELKVSSELIYRPLDDSENVKAINTFKTLIHSCYGPAGNLKMIQNVSGGHVCITSSSGRLFDAISISKPVLKLIVEAAKGHLSLFSDSGIFLAVLCCELIEGTLKSHVPKTILMNLNDYILNLCLEYFKSSNCPCKIKLDVQNTEQMLVLVQNVLKTKSGCCLSRLEIKSLSCTILQSYLSTVSEISKNSWGLKNISFVPIEGKSAFESKVFSGYLFEIPNSSISELNWLYNKQKGQNKKQYKLALFNISLAGDFEEFIKAHYEVALDVYSQEAIIIKKVLKLSQHLIANGVHIVACQKVIHPHVKKFLYDHHVLVIDRLSILNMDIFQQLTGAMSISTITDAIPENWYGYIDDAKVQILHNKTFLHLICDPGSVCTLVLCNRSEETLAELKNVCKVALHIIELALIKPEVVIGGGCFEVHLSQFIQEQLLLNIPELISKFTCSHAQILEAGSIFTSALKAVVYNPHGNDQIIDSQEWHLWTSHQNTLLLDYDICACQMIFKKDLEEAKWKFFQEKDCFPNQSKNSVNRIELKIYNNSIIDLLCVKVNALRVATELASLIMNIGMSIEEKG